MLKVKEYLSVWLCIWGVRMSGACFTRVCVHVHMCACWNAGSDWVYGSGLGAGAVRDCFCLGHGDQRGTGFCFASGCEQAECVSPRVCCLCL